MGTWKIRVKAIIDDEMEVEAETEEQAIEAAHQDWSFTEAHSWEEEVLERPEDEENS